LATGRSRRRGAGHLSHKELQMTKHEYQLVRDLNNLDAARRSLSSVYANDYLDGATLGRAVNQLDDFILRLRSAVDLCIEPEKRTKARKGAAT